MQAADPSAEEAGWYALTLDAPLFRGGTGASGSDTVPHLLMPHLTAATAAFLRARFESALQIDILLAMARDESRWWDAGQLAEELSLDEPSVASALEDLAAGNLLDVRIGGTLGYRFSPLQALARRAIAEAVARPRQARAVVARRTS